MCRQNTFLYSDYGNTSTYSGRYLANKNGINTSAKEIMFAVEFVCLSFYLSFCLLATLLKELYSEHSAIDYSRI